MKPIYLISIIFLIIPSIYAECNSDNFYNKIQSTCREDNGICDDGENFSDSDCKITAESFRSFSILKQAWFLRLYILISFILFILRRELWPVLIIILLVIFIYNSPVEDPSIENKDTENCHWEDFTNPGKCLWPSNPYIGYGIIVFILFLFWLKFLKI